MDLDKTIEAGAFISNVLKRETMCAAPRRALPCRCGSGSGALHPLDCCACNDFETRRDATLPWWIYDSTAARCLRDEATILY